MPKKKKIQVAVDLMMVMLLPVLMSYSLAEEAVHEWAGIAMFLLFVVHHILNHRWLKNILKGKYTAPRILRTPCTFLCRSPDDQGGICMPWILCIPRAWC